MEYYIRNKKILSEGGFSKLFEDEVKNKLPKIENKLKNITKPANLNIYLKKEANGLFQIKTTITKIERLAKLVGNFILKTIFFIGFLA